MYPRPGGLSSTTSAGARPEVPSAEREAQRPRLAAQAGDRTTMARVAEREIDELQCTREGPLRHLRIAGSPLERPADFAPDVSQLLGESQCPPEVDATDRGPDLKAGTLVAYSRAGIRFLMGTTISWRAVAASTADRARVGSAKMRATESTRSRERP